jgi:hypothetical protein
MPESPSQPKLTGLVDSSDDGDRSSITDVNGTVARFEMAYNPNPRERLTFGPPLWQRLPSLLFLGFGVAIAFATLLAHTTGASTSLYRFIVLENRTPLAIVIVVAAIATFIRSGMVGVIVTLEGVETRTLSLGMPRVRKYRWAQIDRIVLDEESVLFELWNGTYERLPKVRDGKNLVDLLERIAVGRGRHVTRLKASGPASHRR